MATALRWSARILSALILLLWSFFIVAHLAGDEGRSSRPLTISDYTSLTAMVISLAGLGVAWKWERIGAVVTLSAVSIGAIANWKSLAFPISLIPLTACLFLLSGWMGRRRMRNR
jgi:type III secretory pathway component EscS